jgi:hypothetical protein
LVNRFPRQEALRGPRLYGVVVNPARGVAHAVKRGLGRCLANNVVRSLPAPFRAPLRLSVRRRRATMPA